MSKGGHLGNPGESNETKTGDPRVATIVLNQSQLNLTRDVLQSIVSSSWKANCIILVDNHSTDGSAGQLAKEFPMIEIIQSPVNIGCAGGWNLAARVADEKGVDYLFFVDNDAVVSKDCISRLVATFERDPSLGIVGPRITVTRNDESQAIVGSVIEWERCFYQTIQIATEKLPMDPLVEAAWIPGTAWMVRSALFENVDPLDERYFIYFENSDFSNRAQAKGFTTKIATDAEVVHHENSVFGLNSPARDYDYTRNRIRFFTAHSPRPLFSIYFLISRALLWALRMAVQGSGARSRAILSGILDATLGRSGRASRRSIDSH